MPPSALNNYAHCSKTIGFMQPTEAIQRCRVGRAADFEEVKRVFSHLLAQCRASGISKALLVTDGVLGMTQEELSEVLSSLAKQECPSGFKLACVAPTRETFERWARVEDIGLREGVRTRVFFDEGNAQRWLEL